MFKTRLISGIILVIVLIATVGTGGNVLFGLLAVVSLIGLTELYKVIEVQNKLLGFAGYLATVAYYVLLYTGNLTVFFGVFYVAVMLSYIYQTRMLEDGDIVVWLIFLSSWGCDTCAYCAGMLLGKHKMAPKLSPKKSVEGGIGGVLGAALLGVLFALAVNQWAGAQAGVLEYAIICGVGGMISQVGDLAASAIKRNHEIKDYGKLIPGHGGILDRFDSVIFTAPIIYYLTMALAGNL